jgi:hypothetical protein
MPLKGLKEQGDYAHAGRRRNPERRGNLVSNSGDERFLRGMSGARRFIRLHISVMKNA